MNFPLGVADMQMMAFSATVEEVVVLLGEKSWNQVRHWVCESVFFFFYILNDI